MTHTYRRGDVTAYAAWLEQQTPAVAEVAGRFRPWEFYKWQGREIYGRIVDYHPDGKFIVFQREDGAHFAVTPDQIDLFSVTGEELPPDRLYQAVDKIKAA